MNHAIMANHMISLITSSTTNPRVTKSNFVILDGSASPYDIKITLFSSFLELKLSNFW